MDSAIQSISTGSMLHLAFSFFKLGSWDPEWLGNFPKAAQFIRLRAKKGTQTSVPPDRNKATLPSPSDQVAEGACLNRF